MAADIWPTIHAERRALADDLTDLNSEQWHTPSLCAGWDVHQVLAHLVGLEFMTPPRFFGKFAAAGLNFDKFAAREVAARTAGGPEATLATFREGANRTTSPPGPKASWLGENFVHGEDIRRPLGIRRTYPTDEVARALAFYLSSNAIIGGKRRMAGVTLTATDAEFVTGSGPAVEGPAIALLLATAGRGAALDELSGPGLETLRSRFP